MKKLFILFALFAITAQAQYKIEGTLNPADKFSWVILYKIEGAKQLFVKSGKIENGQFKFELPADAKVGMYRVSYKTEGAGFVDFLFNKEDIRFRFNPNSAEESIHFDSSSENILYQDYIKVVALEQYKLDSLQVAYLKGPSANTEKLYNNQLKEITALQASYVKKAKGKMVEDFIKANNRYNSTSISKDSQAYLNMVVKHFFDNIDFNNKTLYNSTFLVDRITDYVFYMNYSEDEKTQENLHKKAIKDVLGRVKDPVFKKDIVEFLVTQFINYQRVTFVDYLMSSYYDPLPKNIKDQEFLALVKEKTIVEVGRIAPDISWTENGKNYKLSTLKEASNYVLIFWSTTCSHCTREIPLLHSFMKGKKNTKIIAFGMEESSANWKSYIKGLSGWHHILGLNKWENPTARTYQIYSTPTYIVLNSNKKIIAKPQTLEQLQKIISGLE
ncbi:hypothetical protein GCM10011416_05840 [Polaribacter pacificus]|uniref:Thioredoxin domain-containing protein n=1 Tax=Polaribacter pacificus TaxID=1775173 RepID=A0A917HUX4_9FLAO|nr:thioredoxin-like domain-containing protein [Polaribacter pacificus]GGG91896.1 hypothetical protein GCM10011416_05840 [Polaribacter pacificus]